MLRLQAGTREGFGCCSIQEYARIPQMLRQCPEPASSIYCDGKVLFPLHTHPWKLDWLPVTLQAFCGRHEILSSLITEWITFFVKNFFCKIVDLKSIEP